MDWIRTVNRAIAYMEEHLTDRIELEDIAGSVHLSASHFHRAIAVLSRSNPSSATSKNPFCMTRAERFFVACAHVI